MTEILHRISDLLTNHGKDLYGSEAVTQTQHALQCARLAEAESAPADLIAAALLHDIGHLLEKDFGAGKPLEDRFHQNLGETFLSEHFGPEVTQPVKLHVAAKRYLCATDESYFATLSPASVHSLDLQGGPMSEEEIAEFETNPHYKEALRLRIWDDRAKDPNAETPGVAHFMAYVSQSMGGAKAAS